RRVGHCPRLGLVLSSNRVSLRRPPGEDGRLELLRHGATPILGGCRQSSSAQRLGPVTKCQAQLRSIIPWISLLSSSMTSTGVPFGAPTRTSRSPRSL